MISCEVPFLLFLIFALVVFFSFPAFMLLHCVYVFFSFHSVCFSGLCFSSIRYDVELERAKKPAIRAILQGDASGARPLVLCVSRVFTPEELGDRLGTAAAVIEVRQ